MQNICYAYLASLSVKHLTHMTNQLFPLSAKNVSVIIFVLSGQHATWPVLADKQNLDHFKVRPLSVFLPGYLFTFVAT